MKVINVMAASLDGAIAAEPLEGDQSRHGYNLTNKTDQEHVRCMLLEADAVIMGANSVRASRKVWSLKNSKGIYPPWVIFTEQGFSTDLPFWDQHESPRILASKRGLSEDFSKRTNVEQWIYGIHPPGKYVLDQLAKMGGIKTVLLFGGGHVNRIFYRENLVDELILTLSPVIIAGKNSPRLVNPELEKPCQLSLCSVESSGDHVYLKYKILKNTVGTFA